MFRRQNFAGIKKKKRRMPEWDSTISDLSVHKASSEEVQHRKLIHMSKNVDKARRELKEKRNRKNQDDITPGEIELEMKKLAILREVLYDHDDLNEVLKRVDSTMSSVKNVFHEAPSRKSGNLNVTAAPGQKIGAHDVSLMASAREPVSQMSLLSESIMDKKALNEHEDFSSDDEGEGEATFESKVDYNRFLNLLKNSLTQSLTEATKQKVLEAPTTPPNKNLPKPLNDTENVNRTMPKTVSFQEKPEKDTCTKEPDFSKTIDKTISVICDNKKEPVARIHNLSSVGNKTYDELQEAVEDVKTKVNELEIKAGKAPQISSPRNGLGGFTESLIEVVTRLATIMNEHEEKLIEQTKINKDLITKNDHLKALVDALTVEVMSIHKQMAEMREKIETNNSTNEVTELKTALDDMKNEIKEMYSKNLQGGQAVLKEDNSPGLIKLDIIPQEISKPPNQEPQDQDDEEEMLKGDMIALLNALRDEKGEIKDVKTDANKDVPIPPMGASEATLPSAQTMAAVESHLRHLQLQHAEAQQRMQELTQHASEMAEKISNNTTSPISTQFCIPEPPTPTDSLQSNHLENSLTFQGNIDNSQSFNFLVPTISDKSNTTVSPNSSIATLTTNDDAVIKRIEVSARTYTSADSEPTPRLLQTNLQPNMDSDVDLNLENIMKKITGKFTMPRTLSPFRPQSNQTVTTGDSPGENEQYQNVLSTIANSQTSLEERISQLNNQHAEAQSRLQRLIQNQVGANVDGNMKTSTSISSDDIMFKTPMNKAPMAWSEVFREDD